jgi:LAO/AO transport system kinase
VYLNLNTFGKVKVNLLFLSIQTNKNSVKMEASHRKRFTAQQYIDAILQQDRMMLARAITLVESNLEEDQKLSKIILEAILPHTGNSMRVGITGVPGVGKSTFIENFGLEIIDKTQKKIAILAIDPTSQKTKGSILGDKTRMEKLALHPKAYIRPSPAGSSLGGTARKTRETLLLCEAAGFEIILIETVGVGQSETVVSEMTDFFLLLMLAGAGDELQGIKKGIMEMADMLVITKADGENRHKALVAKNEYQSALHLFRPSEMGWQVPVLTCSALHREGLSDIWQHIENFFQKSKSSHFFEKKRKEQQISWLHESIKHQLLTFFYKKEYVKKALEIAQQAVETGKKDALHAAEDVFKVILEQMKTADS